MRPLSRRRFLGVSALATVAAACSSTVSDGSVATRPPSRPATSGAVPKLDVRTVVMVGDSITRGSSDEVTATLAAVGITATVDGENGRRIEVGNGKGGVALSGLKTIFNLLAEGAAPDAWVIELGTNDVGSYADADAYTALIEQVLAMLPTDRGLVWVNTYRPQYPEHTDMFNMVLALALQDRPHAVVADWWSLASDKEKDLLRDDQLHPNDAGQQALADLVLQALQRL